MVAMIIRFIESDRRLQRFGSSISSSAPRLPASLGRLRKSRPASQRHQLVTFILEVG